MAAAAVWEPVMVCVCVARPKFASMHSCMSSVMAVNVDWWFLDGILLSLSWPPMTTTITTMQPFDNELWHLVWRYFDYTSIHFMHPFIYLLSHSHSHIYKTHRILVGFFSSSSCHSQRYIINATEICRENISFSMYSVLWIIIWCVRAFWSIFASVTVNCDVSI